MEINKAQDIIIIPDFFKDKPAVFLDDFKHEILKGSLVLPSVERNHYLPWMGTSKRNVSSTALTVSLSDGTRETVDLFCKAFASTERQNAYDEMINASLAISRGINTPTMVCIVNVDNEPILISQLIQNVVPLSSFDLSFSETNTKTYSPDDLLKEFTPYIANIHNLGVAHGDLHLGQLGFQLHESRPPSKILFDLENVTFLEDNELKYKNDYIKTPQVPSLLVQDHITTFERHALEDITEFAVRLKRREFPMDCQELVDRVAELYYLSRVQSFGFTSTFKRFREVFVRRFIEMSKNLPLPKPRNRPIIYCFDKIVKNFCRRAS